jgi:glycosyltransferase involved in cell wall biosynthesis
MRIGVNLIPLRPRQMGGAEVYLRDLLAELLKRDGHEYVLVTADYNHDTLPEDSTRCRRVLFLRESGGTGGKLRRMVRALSRRLHKRLRWLDGQGRLRGRHRARRADTLRDLIRRERLDLWFCPFTNLEPRICPVPAVITVHDVQHEYHPEFFHPDELRHRGRFYPESCAAADHIIAVSEFTRQCVLEKFDVEPDAVSVIWEAPGSDFDWRGAVARAPIVRQKYGLPMRYVLYPANTWHHKNHRRLMEALAHYRDRYGEELVLVLTGVSKEGQAGLESAIDSHGLKGLVRMLDYVSRDDLPALYAGAGCLVFPSLFEGFGIPLVEAMRIGCPIAASNVTSIPEIVGDAGVLFDPLDPADISRALKAILRDPGMATELARRGHARADLFSASRAAERTLELFERVVREGRTQGRRGGRETITVDGVYDDRWMGRETVLALAGRALVSVEIEGELSGIPFLAPQELVVQVAGQPAHVVSLSTPGPFSLRVPLPPGGALPGAWEVSLTSNRTFCPTELGLSADSRDLSVQLLLVRAWTQDGREIVKTLGQTAAGRES